MARKKISEMTAIATIDNNNDLLEIADVSAGKSHYVTPASLFASPPAIGDDTPAAGTFTDLLGNGVYIAVSTDLAITAAQMKGQVFVISGARTPVLPAAAVGLKGSFIADSATAFSVDPNATPGTDIMVLNGNAQAAGEKITSDASIYASVYVECKIAGKWIATAEYGIFVNGG